MWTLTPLNIALAATVGLTFPNMAALAFGHVRERAGSASAVQGSVQIGFSGLAGALVSALGNGSPLPMVGVTLAFAVLAAVFVRLFQRRQAGTDLHLA